MSKNAVGKGLKSVFGEKQTSDGDAEINKKEPISQHHDDTSQGVSGVPEEEFGRELSADLKEMVKSLPQAPTQGRPSDFREKYRHVPLKKVLYEIPEDAHKRLKMLAVKTNRSMQELAVEALIEFLDKYAPESE